jgi:hypothetical protein
MTADSVEIPAITQGQLNCFTNELFKLVPRRLLPTQQGRVRGAGGLQTIGERLRMLTTRYNSWRYAAQIVLSEATEGCRNETGWAVVASAAARGISDDIVWQLFEKYFAGWDGFSESDLASAINRTRPVHQPSSMHLNSQLHPGYTNVRRR